MLLWPARRKAAGETYGMKEFRLTVLCRSLGWPLLSLDLIEDGKSLDGTKYFRPGTSYSVRCRGEVKVVLAFGTIM